LSLAAARIGARVVCPSVGSRGDWWQPHGLATVRASLAYLARTGIRHVFLAGLSNGAVGAGMIATRIADLLDGLILISGAPATPAPARLPLLVIQGEYDSLMHAGLARRYAQSSSAPHAYVSIPGGHFVFLSHAERVTAAIGDWLAAQQH
jgi:pimeloyl-ACP methyl ester carboxylesterase